LLKCLRHQEYRELAPAKPLLELQGSPMAEQERPEGEQAPDEPSDHSLLRRLRLGNQDAATQLYLRYAQRLRALTRAKCAPDLAPRLDADDIVQSVFRTFFRRVAKGDYEVPDGEELWKLFLVIALNKIRTVGAYHRAAKRDIRASSGAEALEHAAEVATGGDATSLSILRMVIDEVLAGLSPPHRDIINLRIEGHEVAAIAERLGRSKRSVERILQGFREMLAGQIREDE
jgi:RNA polymerase sigma-70 factor (ECF subfamily)